MQVDGCSRALLSALEHLTEHCFKCSTQVKQVWGSKRWTRSVFIAGSSCYREFFARWECKLEFKERPVGVPKAVLGCLPLVWYFLSWTESDIVRFSCGFLLVLFCGGFFCLFAVWVLGFFKIEMEFKRDYLRIDYYQISVKLMQDCFTSAAVVKIPDQI